MSTKAIRLIVSVFFPIIGLFHVSICHAQLPTETKEVYLRILEVEKKNADTVYASIWGGSNIGIQLGSTGSIIAKNDFSSDRRFTEIGFASIIRVTDSFAVLLIRPVAQAATNTLYQTVMGDYLKIKIEVPKLAYHSVFFEMALMNVEFTNIDKKPFYTFEQLLKNDSKHLEDSLLSICTADVLDTYDRVKNRTDTIFDVYKVPLKEGRYTGKSIFNVLAACSNKDVYTFINYAKNKPADYLGNTWQVTVKFADWLFVNAPFSSKEVYDTVAAYKNKPILLKQFIQKNREVFVRQEFVRDWIVEALDAMESENDEQYKRIMEIAKLALPYLQDNNSYGFYYYTEASYLKAKDKYSKAIASSDSAIKYFDKAGFFYFSVLCYYIQGDSYRYLSKLDDAIKAYEKGFAWSKKNSGEIADKKLKNLTATYYKSIGYSWFDKEEYKKAIDNLSMSINNYKTIGDYQSTKSAIAVQKELAKIYKKQGELTKAMEIYIEQLALYRNLNDSKNEAEALDNIAFIQFSLGSYRQSIDSYSKARNIYLGFKNLYNAGYSQSNIGQAFWNLGKYDSAIDGHNTALYYRRQDGSNDGQAYSWKMLGNLYKLTGEKPKALAAYDSAASYYKLAKDSSNLKGLLADVGDIYYNDKQHQKAFDYYLKRHNLNLAGNDKIATASSAYQVGEAATYFDMKLAKKYALHSLGLAQQAGDKNNEYNACTLLGFIGFRDYDYDEGETYFTKALNIAIAQKNKSSETVCYQYMSRAYSSKLDFDKALLYVQKAIKIADSLGDKSKLPDLYRTLGSTIQSKGDFYGARKEYQKSIDIAYSINSRADVGYGYSIITFLYIIQGELAKAEQSTDSLYSIFSQLNNSWQMAEAYANKGLVYEAKADGINAVKYYLLADSIYKKEKDIYSQAICQTQLGCVYYYQADFDNALKYFHEADRMLSTINATTEAHILSPINIGEALYFKKELAKAEPYLLKGYKMAIDKKAGRMQTIGASFLGTLYYDLKKYELAEKYLLEGFAMAQKSNETDLYINSGMYLGKLYVALNQPVKAQEYYRKTVDFLKTIDHSNYTWMALYEYGLNFYNNKQHDSAIVYFKKAVEIVENSSQNLFGGAEAKKIYNADERKIDLYNKLVASLAKINKPDDALYYADKGNTHAVKEQMEGAGLVTNDKEKSDAIKKGGELLQKKNAVEQAIVKEKAKPEKEQNKQLIASLESVKNVAEADYTSYIEQLQKKYEDLQAYFSNTNPKDFKNYIEDIPDSTIVVLYVINKSKDNNQLLIFTVTNKETAIKVVDLKQDIDKQASKFLSILRNPNNATGTGAVTLRSTLKPVDDVRGDFKVESGDLYNLLITPIAEQLKDKKNICFIPNGKLSSIPFQCLGYTDESKKFHFIVEDKAIFYTSKIDIFRKSFKKRSIENAMVAFGNPDKSLPGATKEVNEIGKIVNGTTVFVEEQATETKAKEGLTKYTFIHYATHGVLDYEKFENSFLLFAADASNDGKMTIGEINGITKPSSSLVFLSACETAVNKEEAKGYYSSPANAFLTNRVDAVVGSLWKVPDEATDLLVTEFYNNLKNKGMGNAEALRHAQATVSQNPKYVHPFFWSAFVLYGEWR